MDVPPTRGAWGAPEATLYEHIDNRPDQRPRHFRDAFETDGDCTIPMYERISTGTWSKIMGLLINPSKQANKR